MLNCLMKSFLVWMGLFLYFILILCMSTMAATMYRYHVGEYG